MIVIDEAAWAEMVGHAEAAYPEECCGILLGAQEGGQHVTFAVRCANQAAGSSRNRFLIDPEQLLEVRSQGRAAGLDIVGFYHSHPDKGAYFSESDIRHCWPLFANIVLSVERGRLREAKAFRVDQEQTKAAPLELVRAAPPADL